MSGLSEIPTNHFFLTIALYQDHTIKANDTNIKVSLVEFTLSTLVIQSGCSEIPNNHSGSKYNRLSPLKKIIFTKRFC